jgi:hypothetical protein
LLLAHKCIGAWTCVLLALSPAARSGDAEVQAAERHDSSWFRQVTPGGTLRVVNPFGDVHARFGGYGDEAEILATFQRLDPERPDLDVVFSSEGTRTDLVVTDPAADTGENPTGDRVDLVVFVPIDVSLDVRADKGDVEVKGLRGNLEATSVKGDIRVRSVGGWVRAKTSSGDITALLETGVTNEPQELATETGDIEVWLWEDADQRVEIRTSGEISTDFSIDIEHRPFEEPSKYAEAVVGQGEAELLLRSKEGDVRLLRSVRNFRREP